MTRKDREALEMHLQNGMTQYKRICKDIEHMNVQYPELKEWLNDKDLYNDPIIMEYNELDQEKVNCHGRCIEILKDLGIEFKDRAESYEYLLGRV